MLFIIEEKKGRRGFNTEGCLDVCLAGTSVILSYSPKGLGTEVINFNSHSVASGCFDFIVKNFYRRVAAEFILTESVAITDINGVSGVTTGYYINYLTEGGLENGE